MQLSQDTRLKKARFKKYIFVHVLTHNAKCCVKKQPSPRSRQIETTVCLFSEKKTSLLTNAALSRPSIKTKARLKKFIRLHTHPYRILLCKILFKIKNGETLLPEHFKLVEILVLQPSTSF